ncbi:hypothetical protein [Roseisolibacter sp. H3M3-2]|uniref:hypothetical protein n=1 Tax=Roseisolibacter sp. H3M3-2 TaxID=3031323 RepID=UPI0023DC8FE1|nr:hypothetical protein [Roseisolibacter sp. H3M3-2]MDF1505803.1 hypothetical protein [Roseisolibacter sp. H3M3-2]
MRPCFPCLLALAALAGCAPQDRRVADSAAAVGTTPDSAAGAMASPPAAPLALARLAGRWEMRAIPDAGADTAVTHYTLTATADSTGWSFTFGDRPPVPVRVVSVAGDSMVLEAGPYASVRRAGRQVSTHNVLRMEGDRLVGRTTARYSGRGADSVLTLRTEGERRP